MLASGVYSIDIDTDRDTDGFVTVFNSMHGSYLSAIATSFCGRKVPSVSMYMTLPSAPPWSKGLWAVTQSV